MANEQNLIPFDQRAESVQREIRSKGGKAKAKKMREQATFREIINELLNEKGGSYKGKEVSKKQMIVIQALKYMLNDDETLDAREYARMFELVRDTIGEKPSEKVELSVDDESAREIDEYFASKYNSPVGE